MSKPRACRNQSPPASAVTTPRSRPRLARQLISSQLPVKAWHTYLNDPTLADAILDRVGHSSHKIELKATKSLRDTADAQTA